MLPRLFLVAALPATLLFAACGGDDDDDTTPPTAPSSATTTAEKTPTTKAASATTSTGKISLTNPTTTPSGLKYEDKKVGDGASPKNGQRVTVHYTLQLANGTKIESSRDKNTPFTFVIGHQGLGRGCPDVEGRRDSRPRHSAGAGLRLARQRAYPGELGAALRGGTTRGPVADSAIL
jgi:hypothetical protein